MKLVEALRENLNHHWNTQDFKDFLSKSITAFLSAIFYFQACNSEVPFKGLDSPLQDGNSSSIEDQISLLRRKIFTCRQVNTVSNQPMENSSLQNNQPRKTKKPKQANKNPNPTNQTQRKNQLNQHPPAPSKTSHSSKGLNAASFLYCTALVQVLC